MAECDSQQLGRIAPSLADEITPLSGALANDNDRRDASADNEPASPGAVGADTAISSQPGTLVEQRAHVSARAARSSGPRAKQSVPPALRRAVLLRDHRRCRVPGCRNASFLDLHHLALRSKGGQNQAHNLVTSCSVHHRAAHRGELLIEGSEAAGVRFCHADGRAYGQTVEPSVLEAQTKTFAALRGLGFREAEVRAVLAQLRGERNLRQATTEQLLRAALACLRRPRTRA